MRTWQFFPFIFLSIRGGGCIVECVLRIAMAQEAGEKAKEQYAPASLASRRAEAHAHLANQNYWFVLRRSFHKLSSKAVPLLFVFVRVQYMVYELFVSLLYMGVHDGV